MPYIYCITNLINGKQYVGQTIRTIQERFLDHSHQAYCEDGETRPICRAIRKYGIENFKIEELEEVALDKLNEREVYWIQELQTYGKNGYNATKGGDGKCLYDINDFIHLYNLGYSCNAIAEKVGCRRATVTRILKANGIKLKGNTRIINQYDEAGNFIQTFNTIKDAALWIQNYVSPNSNTKSIAAKITTCCKNKSKTAHHYIWKYADLEPTYKK